MSKKDQNPLLAPAIAAIEGLALSELGADDLGKHDRVGKILKLAQSLQSMFARGAKGALSALDADEEDGLGRYAIRGDHVDMQRETLMLAQKQIDQNKKSAATKLTELLTLREKYNAGGDSLPTWLSKAIERAEAAAEAELAAEAAAPTEETPVAA